MLLVDDRPLAKVIKKRKWCSFTPCVVVSIRGETYFRRLDEWHDSTLLVWVDTTLAKGGTGAIELTPASMSYLERISKPMLLLFLNITKARLGGDTPDAQALSAVNKVSQDKVLSERFTFTYTDGIAYGDRMAALGLISGVLPSMAFNTKVSTHSLPAST